MGLVFYDSLVQGTEVRARLWYGNFSSPLILNDDLVGVVFQLIVVIIVDLLLLLWVIFRIVLPRLAPYLACHHDALHHYRHLPNKKILDDS